MNWNELKLYQKILIIVVALIVAYFVYGLFSKFVATHIREPTHLGTINWNNIEP